MNRISQNGFALVGAIFILVVLGAVSAYMLRVSMVQSATGILASKSVAAHYAARAGLEWAAVKATTGDCDDGSVTTYSFQVERYDVDVVCTERTHWDPDAVTITVIRSTAVDGTLGTAEMVSRTVEAEVTMAP